MTIAAFDLCTDSSTWHTREKQKTIAAAAFAIIYFIYLFIY